MAATSIQPRCGSIVALLPTQGCLACILMQQSCSTHQQLRMMRAWAGSQQTPTQKIPTQQSRRRQTRLRNRREMQNRREMRLQKQRETQKQKEKQLPMMRALLRHQTRLPALPRHQTQMPAPPRHPLRYLGRNCPRHHARVVNACHIGVGATCQPLGRHPVRQGAVACQPLEQGVRRAAVEYRSLGQGHGRAAARCLPVGQGPRRAALGCQPFGQSHRRAAAGRQRPGDWDSQVCRLLAHR